MEQQEQKRNDYVNENQEDKSSMITKRCPSTARMDCHHMFSKPTNVTMMCK